MINANNVNDPWTHSPEYTITAIDNERQKRGGNKRKNAAGKDGKLELGEREGKLGRKNLSLP